MGSSTYDTSARFCRATNAGYATKSVDAIFTQQKERKIHKDMDPKGITVRESRDSEAHPNVLPVILALDVTGSMGHIPHDLIKDGLPKLMGGLIQKGADVSLLFLGIGDHESDRAPLQVGQFESGDAELDLWLTRTYIEGNGGGNGGESYLLAWHFANNFVSTDAQEKRGQKPFLFTVGDEPNLRALPSSALSEIYGKSFESTSAATLLAAAQEKFRVYHLHVTHSSGAKRSLQGWKDALGENCIEVPDYREIPAVITKIVVAASAAASEEVAPVTTVVAPADKPAKPATKSEEML